MIAVALRNLAAHKARLALTLISVLLGTAFVAGSFVFTDTLQKSFDAIFATSDKDIDVRVQAEHSYQPGVPVDVASRIAKVAGVRATEDQIDAPVVLVDPDGKRISTGGAPSVGAAWVGAGQTISAVPPFTAGHAPTRAGEVVVNDSAASKYHLAVGDRVKLVVPNASVATLTIVGVYQVDFDTGGYLGALLARDQAMSLFSDGRHYSGVNVAAAPGVTEQVLADRIRAQLPAGLEAKTGTEVRKEDSQNVADALGFITTLLLGFGIVALLVGTFIIYNTFSMIVAQRQRELALLRAIGASRAQILRSVVLEAVLTGLVGSLLGLAGGVGLAYGLHALLDALDVGLPSSSAVVSARTVIVSVVLGTVVTVVAAFAPARRASRIAPVAALREEFATPAHAGLVRRTVLGVVVLALGAAVTVAGVANDSAGTAASLIGLGLLGVLAASMLLSPVLARWVIAPLGRLAGRGVVGRLARTNAVRNPRRTAATAFALTLGLVLVAGLAVIGASAKASIDKLFADNVTADYILTGPDEALVPVRAAAAAAAVDGVSSLTQLQNLTALVDGTRRNGTGVDGPLQPVLKVKLLQGSANTDGRRMIVSQQTLKDRGWRMGTTHRLSVPGSAPITVTVTGVYADDDLVGPWVVDGDVYRALTPRNQWGDVVALVKATPGTDLATLRAGLEKAVNSYYIVDVQTRTEFQGEIASQIDGLLGLLYGLLGLAIVIAILGIINTQALSVVERRREIGMLRAIGMQRKQVRRTIYVESALIAVFGALLGVVVGLVFGALITGTLSSQGLTETAIPWGQAVIYLVLAAVVGVLAALWPGFRAARTPPLEAIAAA